jgi:hypothetical protein
MGQSLGDRLEAAYDERKRGFERRAADVAHNASDLEARGRQAYADAIRTGQNVLARTPHELRQLGLLALQGAELQGGVGMGTPAQNRRIVRQGKAALSGAADEFTFGAADPTLAAGDALIEGGVDGFGNRYSTSMATKRSDDAYDAEHYGSARTAGRVAGLAGSVAVMGAPAVERSIVRLLPQGAKVAEGLNLSKYGLDPRGLNTMAAVGGAGAGFAGQGVSDLMTGHLSSPADYFTAAGGGAIDGLATLHFGPAAGGAVGGGVTTAAQDYVDGRPPSLDRVLDSAHLSALMGQVAGTAGSYNSSRLPPKVKGDLGEAVSYFKTIAEGRGIPRLRKRFNLDDGGYSITDQMFPTSAPGKNIGIKEVKAGPTARLSTPQTGTRAQPNVDYVIDGYRFGDFGKMAGAAISPYGAQLVDQDAYPWPEP